MRSTSTLALTLSLFAVALCGGCGADIEGFLFDRLQFGQPGQSVEIERDLVYAERETGPLKFDLFRLAGGGDQMPLVVCVHGGAWTRGDRQDMEAIAWDLASRGFASATIDFRLVTADVVYPAPVVDVLDAVDYFRAHAAELRVDPDRMVMLGASSGGHLALLAGMPGDLSKIDPNRAPGTPTHVAAIVNFAGPTDFTVDPDSVLSWQLETVAELLGYTVDQLMLRDEVLPVLAAASPVTYARANGPPVLTIHGAGDIVVPVTQGRLLRDALNAAGQPQTYLEIPWYGHPDGGDWKNPTGQFYIRPAVLAFLREHLQ